ncbi:sensor histidine kinase [Haloarcula salinisoli]|uniref:histidine kinase n=1 Tax=Haloarcula salinisoli TaxID=2487746 RepID=A0A8J8C889_9EURY|nr:histidine kinase N-terminal 7TM domain-containing protein [Halomicroarcula salinisoli]MBX0304092.1 PAS domain-containing protein [Halomicroarcula salinisoli]
MSALTHPVVVLGMLSTALALLIAGVAWQQRATRGARTYTVLMVTLAVWSTLYVGQLLVPTVAGKRPWFVARHAMSPLFAMAFWVFAAQYTDRRELLDRRLLAPIVAVGLAFVGLVLVNPGELYWSALALDTMGALFLLELTLGPLFWLNCVYIFGVVGVAHVLIVSTWKRTFASYRPQLLVLTVVGSVEFGLSVLFLSEHTTLLPALNPWPNVQLITYGATIAAIPIGWSYVNDFFFDIQPLARQAVIESMDDAVYIVDREGTIRYTNPPGNRLLGRSPDADAPTEPVETAFAARPTLLSCYEQSVAGTPVDDDTILACEIDGEQRFYDIGVSTIENSTGEGAGVVVVGRDITEERRQRGQLQVRTAQLERQNERLDQFGQFVSHDLRNPIQVASGYVELARETEDLSRLDDVDRAIRRMSEMVEELRELTTVDRDSLDADRVNVAQTAHTAWAHVDTGDAALRVSENAIIIADPDYLLHIFENLFRNSMEHGLPEETGAALGDGGGLTVTVGPLDGGFFIEDDGVGIPEDERDAVLDHGYTTTNEGTGLGMSIVRTIADAHEWTVSVTESDAGGARFEFRNVDRPGE